MIIINYRTTVLVVNNKNKFRFMSIDTDLASNNMMQVDLKVGICVQTSAIVMCDSTNYYVMLLFMFRYTPPKQFTHLHKMESSLT